MVSDLQIAQKISSGEFSSGAECMFIKLDEKWGLKLYSDEERRDSAHENHANFLRYGLAPELKRKITLPSIIERRYGYICEIVEVLIDPIYLYGFKRFKGNPVYDNFDYDSWNEYTDELTESIEEKYSEEIQELIEKINENDLSYHDCHIGNFGLKNGKMVCIDFDNLD